MKAHDVRHLCVCEICGGLVDDRGSIRPRGKHFEHYFSKDYNLDAHWHPGCYVEKYGEEGVFVLAREERRKFRICDVTIDTMRRLLDDI